MNEGLEIATIQTNRKYFKTEDLPERLSSSLFVLAGLNLLTFWLIGAISGILLLTLSAILILIKTGLEIDLDEHRYRRYYSLFGYEKGKWRKLPEIKYISVVRIIQREKKFQISSNQFVPAGPSRHRCRIHLITNNERIRYIKVLSSSRKEAIDLALIMGEQFNLNVLDFTTHEKHWIRKESTQEIDAKT